MTKIEIIDSHTGGEPTRVIVAGGPDLGHGTMAERAACFAQEHDHVRRATVNEPRGSDVLVGALLCEPVNPKAACGVIFFNNVGLLGMCGHGTIGLVETLKYLGRIGVGDHLIETTVGDVTVSLHADGRVSVTNVLSKRYLKQVALDVPGLGEVRGDVAWGGNFFFLVSDHSERLHISNVERLLFVSKEIRIALDRAMLIGEIIDHVELFGPPADPANHSRNFVFCPGGAYDRSPCGTGTSAKLACLAADGKLAPGQIWRQESILGSVFEAHYELVEGGIRPTITGTAHITAQATLIVSEGDPFAWGIPT
ncbi:MAG: 4-hydroxyproline epimerase [Fimbriiglobus sp.]